jgi:hypothetical protein
MADAKVTEWNMPRVLLDLVPEAAPSIARIAVEAYDANPRPRTLSMKT